MYGAADGAPKRESDALNPLTAYARSKAATEAALAALDAGAMTTTALRFATACGMSDRLRLDLVLNDFVACAIAAGEISVLSDGSPWRPPHRCEGHGARHRLGPSIGRANRAAHISPSMPAATAGIIRSATLPPPSRRRSQASRSISAPTHRPTNAPTASTSPLFAELAPNHLPQTDLEQSIAELKNGLIAMGFHDADFRASSLMRLKVLEGHMTEGRLTGALRWT